MKYFLILFILISTSTIAGSNLEKLLYSTEGINTDILIIQKDGVTLTEKYSRGYAKEQKHLSWSMAKTFAGIIIGQAIEDGYLSLEEKVSKSFPDFKLDTSILDLLQMSSGIKFSEQYSGLPVNADVTRMLYLEGIKDGFAKYTLNLPPTKENPGTYFYYSSGDTNLLMEILKRKMSKNEYDNYPWKKLFNPLGIDATFEQDSKGTFVGSSYIYMSGRDYLKVAELIRDKGKYNNQQVIPKWYVELMNKVAPGANDKTLIGTSPRKAYSVQTATNKPIMGRKLPPEFKYLPADSIIFMGHQGQLIAVSPKEKYIVIRLGKDKGKSLDRNLFFKLTAEFVRSKGKKLSLAATTHDSLYKSFTKKPQTIRPPNTTKLTDYLRVPKLIKASAAKEYCSCFFIEKRTELECKKDLKDFLPFVPRLYIEDSIDTKTYIVHADFIVDSSAKAIFSSTNKGCSLIQ